MAEFEAHSNGWFWQTDVGGNITYLTTKVAVLFQSLGLDSNRSIAQAHPNSRFNGLKTRID
ncbi:hypothetical protein [Sphingomonas sp. UYP23]